MRGQFGESVPASPARRRRDGHEAAIAGHRGARGHALAPRYGSRCPCRAVLHLLRVVDPVASGTEALAYTRENFEYVMENLREGADSAGRDWRELDLAAWVVWACAEDSAAAKETARIMVAFYLAAMP